LAPLKNKLFPCKKEV